MRKIPWRPILQTIFAIALMVLGTIFFYKNRGEVRAVAHAFRQAHPAYLIIAFVAAIVTVVAQAQAIRLAYVSIEKNVTLWECISLYLKRFFLSPFIPGGFSVAQYTLTKDLAHYEMKQSEHAFASTAYVIVSMSSYLILLVPTVLLASNTLSSNQGRTTEIAYALVMLVLIGALVGVLFRRTILQRIRKWVAPHVGHFHSTPLYKAFGVCLLVDISGILMLWSAIRSIDAQISIPVAAGAYIITILVLTISPLFQGILVVESVLTFFLTQAGVPAGDALAGTLIFRGFQLWLPLIVGGGLYVWPLYLQAREHLGMGN